MIDLLNFDSERQNVKNNINILFVLTSTLCLNKPSIIKTINRQRPNTRKVKPEKSLEIKLKIWYHIVG